MTTLDAEGILIAVPAALDALRIEIGHRIQSDHVVHDDFAPAPTTA